MLASPTRLCGRSRFCERVGFDHACCFCLVVPIGLRSKLTNQPPRRRLNPAYVLGPLDVLLASCHSNVILGLRVAEHANAFPPPTVEEAPFMQLGFGRAPTDFEITRTQFKRWVLLNGFRDVHKALRVTMERLFVFKNLQRQLSTDGRSRHLIEEEQRFRRQAAEWHYPTLMDRLEPLLKQPFKYRAHVNSYNLARNCLEHGHGIVSERYCNNPEKDKLILRGGMRF